MSLSDKLLAAALSGAVLGAAGCASTSSQSQPTTPESQAEDKHHCNSEGGAEGEKHHCKGEHSCNGEHSCGGKNGCKGEHKAGDASGAEASPEGEHKGE